MKRRFGTLALATTLCAGSLWGQELRPVAPPIRNTYGSSNLSDYVIDASELTVVSTDDHYSTINNSQLRYLKGGEGLGFEAPVHLPGGALVKSIEIFYYDGSTTGQVEALLGICDYAGFSCAFQQTDSGCATTICSGNAFAPGYYFTAGNFFLPFTVDNLSHRYFLAAGNTTGDGSTAISQIVIRYQLQVGGAPKAPTFTDVPTDSIYYQFIEALAGSGITGGCNQVPLRYCPDRPITRAEMAVFLAKAVGLYFP